MVRQRKNLTEIYKPYLCKLMAFIDVGAKHGVLMKGGEKALEAASKVNAVVFDKTGTLTKGKPCNYRLLAIG
jgi:cation transport ATPase